MSIVWSVIVGLSLIGIQVMTMWLVCRRHKREMDVQTGTMAIIAASMQPPEIRAHCQRVADISEKIAQELKLPPKRLALVRSAGILHEIDGANMLTKDTPLEFARLHLADHFDCITHDAVEPMSYDEAVENIRRYAGTRFDPAAVKALMRAVSATGHSG